MSTRSRLLALTAAGLMALTAAPAIAHSGKPFDARAQLRPVPHAGSADGGSHSTATVEVVRHGNELTITVNARNVAPNLPHAQHIHGEGDRCPLPSARDARVDDGLIDTVEGVPFYGGVKVSLTTSGGTAAGDALAVDRFPVADADGTYTYSRTLTVGSDIPADVADELGEYEVVIHGIDINGNGAYDFDAGTSSLRGDLPLEATVPAACGGFIANR